MTDRELLELAAKAAGYTINEHVKDGAWVHDNSKPMKGDGEPCLFLWRPREDDGHAFRLAAAIARSQPGAHFDITVNIMHDGRGFAAAGFHSHSQLKEFEVGEDLLQPARIAILRAAAELGRRMP